MAGGPSAEVKRDSAKRDTSHLVQEGWGHLLRNFLIVALVAASVWLLVSGVRYSISFGSHIIFSPFEVEHAAGEPGKPEGEATASAEAAHEEGGSDMTTAWLILFGVLIGGGLVRGILIQLPSWRSSEGDGMGVSLEHFHATYDHPEHGDQPRYDEPDFAQAGRRAVMTSLTVGTGGSGGIEAPVVPIGECIGAGWARLLKVPDPDDLRIYQMAGISAAVVTLLDAPFTAALFAAEVIYTDRILYRTMMYSLVAALVAYAFNNHFLDFQPLFTPDGHSHIYSLFEYAEIAAVALICSAPAGLGVGWIFKVTKKALKPIPSLFRASVGVGLAGLIAFGVWAWLGVEPFHILGVGEETIIMVMSREGNALLQVWWVLFLLVATKAVATGLTLGSGGSAGALVPAMFMGGLMGGGVFHLLSALGYAAAGDPALYVVAGLASALVAVVQVPLAAIAFVMEVFGATYGPPAIVSCVLTYMIAKRLRLYTEPKKRPAELSAEDQA
jgi:CIC family chloride channel protein